jgi:hypothetical protein
MKPHGKTLKRYLIVWDCNTSEIFTMLSGAENRINADDTDLLVNCLVSCIDDSETWKAIVSELRKVVNLNNYHESSALTSNVRNLVNECLKFPQGIETLLRRVRSRKAETYAWKELAKLSFRLLTNPPEVFKQLSDELITNVDKIELSDERLMAIWTDHFNEMLPVRPYSSFEAALYLFQRPVEVGVRFISLLIEEAIPPEQKEQLRAWIEKATKVLPVKLSNPPPSLSTPENYLLIQIQPVTAEARLFKLHCWLQIGEQVTFISIDPERVYELSEVGEQIKSLASQLVNDIGYNFAIELVVKRGIFNHDVTKWEIKVGETASRMIEEVPIVFRCLERFEARRNDMLREKRGLSVAQAIMERLRSGSQNTAQVNLAGWREKWETVRNYANKDIEELIRHIELIDQDIKKLWEDLKQATEGICVSLGFVPEIDDAAKEMLTRVLDRGTPIVISFREIPGGICIDRETLRKNLLNQIADGQAKVTLSELRNHIWKVSKEAAKKDPQGDIRRYVTLLYDDYDRIPQYPTNQLKDEND